jgi:type I restriction enzyme, S subunit
MINQVTRYMLDEIKIFLPPLPEQQRIVSILEEAFAAIAKAKANAEQNLLNTKELFESYLQGVFENGNWQMKRLGDLSERVSVGHVGETTKFYCDSDIGVPFLRSQNVRSGYLDLKGLQFITPDFHESLKKSQLKKDDILFVRVGANRGDCCVVKEDFKKLNCANIVFARLKEGNVDFIDKYCQSVVGRKQLLGMSVGAAQGVINTKSVAELRIPVPSLKEQETIVRQLDALRAETQKLEAVYQKKIADLEELKKSILQKAFSGELRTEKEIML